MATLTVAKLTKLREPFPAEMVKQNQDGMDYVAIDGYINRWLEVMGPDYSFEIVGPVELILLPEDMKTRSGKRQYLARVTAAISVGETRRCGVGADVSHDPDKAVKTAQAEAFKKASHQFGVALELWDEDHRTQLATDRALAAGDEQTLKAEVTRRAKEGLGKTRVTADEIADYFNVTVADLGDLATLKRILGL